MSVAIAEPFDIAAETHWHTVGEQKSNVGSDPTIIAALTNALGADNVDPEHSGAAETSRLCRFMLSPWQTFLAHQSRSCSRRRDRMDELNDFAEWGRGSNGADEKSFASGGRRRHRRNSGADDK